MEIKTCEEYVIKELERAQNELSLIKKENEELKAQNEGYNQILDNINTCEKEFKASGVDMCLAEVLYKAKNIDVINVCHPNKDTHIVIDITMGKEIK